MINNEYIKNEYNDGYGAKSRNASMNDAPIIDIDRIHKKLDNLYDKKDFDEVERLLVFWLNEAIANNDKRSGLALYNEYMGVARKLGKNEKAFESVKNAERLIDELGIQNNISAAIIYINIGTVYKAFGESSKGLLYFEKAKKICDAVLDKDDKLYASLYNNMALALVDVKKFDNAVTYYEKAINIMMKKNGGELDAAISYLNMADLYFSKGKVEGDINDCIYEGKIQSFVEMAWHLLNAAAIKRDEYYRFVCEKCAPSFGFYGFFKYERELRKRAIGNENI